MTATQKKNKHKKKAKISQEKKESILQSITIDRSQSTTAAEDIPEVDVHQKVNNASNLKNDAIYKPSSSNEAVELDEYMEEAREERSVGGSSSADIEDDSINDEFIEEESMYEMHCRKLKERLQREY